MKYLSYSGSDWFMIYHKLFYGSSDWFVIDHKLCYGGSDWFMIDRDNGGCNGTQCVTVVVLMSLSRPGGML